MGKQQKNIINKDLHCGFCEEHIPFNTEARSCIPCDWDMCMDCCGVPVSSAQAKPSLLPVQPSAQQHQMPPAQPQAGPRKPVAPASQKPDSEDDPDHFVCSMTMELMKEPVICADGQSYEKEAITEWLENNETS